MNDEQRHVVFQLFGLDVDFPLLASCFGIIILALLQLSWPAIQTYFRKPKATLVEQPMPVIETIDEDPQEERPRRRFKKDKTSIASWVGSSEGQESTAQDPNTILPAGLDNMSEAGVSVDAKGNVLDLDGAIIEPGKLLYVDAGQSRHCSAKLRQAEVVAYVRQQIIDRVINTGTVGEDENESANMKLDIIKSIRGLPDADVIEWYNQNRMTLRY